MKFSSLHAGIRLINFLRKIRTQLQFLWETEQKNIYKPSRIEWKKSGLNKSWRDLNSMSGANSLISSLKGSYTFSIFSISFFIMNFKNSYIFYIVSFLHKKIFQQMQGEDKICVIGSANVDSFVYVHHIPAPGETLQALSSMMANGGKGANQAVAVGKLAGSALFVGQVGNDDGKQMLEKEMTAANVELGWKVREDVPTGKAFICVEEKTGENVIVIVGGANTQYESKEKLPVEYSEVITRSKCILLQKQIPMEINVLCAKEAKSKGKTVILDCGGADEPIPEELLQNLDILSPNETELLRIQADIDISNPAEEIRTKILNKYPNLKVLLKLGSKGSAIITKEHFVEVPVVTTSNPAILENYKIEDTVGAGDCFTGAFMVKFEELNWNDPAAYQSNFRKAMTFGNSAAFLCITKKGAMPSMPSRLQVDEFMGKYQLE